MQKTDIRKLVGIKIREIRKKRGFTQDELAEKVSLTGKFIGAIERGDNSASLAKLEVIAKVLDCDLRHFYEIDYLESSDKDLNTLLNNRLKHLSLDNKRMILKLMDWIAN
jgi:transcriptional regulator with XRE-family HTH domain